MNSDEVVVVDEYFEEIGRFFEEQGKKYESILNRYIAALRILKERGICSGDTADALDAYISLASQIKECASDLGTSINTMMKNYIAVIDTKDQYLF